MSSYTFFLVCLQAFLIQTALSQVINSGLNNLALNSGIGSVGIGLNNAVGLGNNIGLGINNLGVGNNIGLGINNLGVGNNIGLGINNLAGINKGISDVAATASLPVTGPFVANGVGELAVTGEIGAAGSTVVTGQVPVLGAVSFGGTIPASGIVSVAGNCGCGNLPL